eukprot:5687881-Amphidinium_carterae.2
MFCKLPWDSTPLHTRIIYSKIRCKRHTNTVISLRILSVVTHNCGVRDALPITSGSRFKEDSGEGFGGA